MSGTPAWASGGRKPESLDDNDTFAYRKHGNQGSVWDMLQQDRALQGVRRSARPVLHIPLHTGQSEWKTGSGVQVKWTCGLIWRVEINTGWNEACVKSKTVLSEMIILLYSLTFDKNFLLPVHLRDMRKAFSLYLWDEPGRNETVLKPSPTYYSALITQKFYRNSKYIWKIPKK